MRWLRRFVDRYESAPRERPSSADDRVQWPAAAWDLGTLIAVLPPGSPLSILNLNWTLGQTGSCFDRGPALWGGAARDVVDLQLYLEGAGRTATHKEAYSARRHVALEIDGALSIGGRLSVEGAFPSYVLRYRQPEAALALDVSFSAWPDIHWWAHLGGAYRHYTRFGDCSLRWEWGADSGVIDAPALLEHAWGGALLPVRVAPRVFRYEVMRLPDGAQAISLWVDGPLWLEVAHVAVQRHGRDRATLAGRSRCQVLEWETHADHAGQPRRVPRRWLGRQVFAGGELRYEAERLSTPRPVIGDGFIHSFAWRAEGAGLEGGAAEGVGYVEQMGRP